MNKKLRTVKNKTNVKVKKENKGGKRMINKELSGKSMSMKKLNKNGGITLIALVVTIVVLIILATVSILAVFGDNGIISSAQDAKSVHEEGKAKETNILEDYASYIGNYLDGKGGGSTGNIDPDTGWDLNKVNKVKSEDNVIVPVPKGYTASTVAGEKSVSSGFVIKEGNDGSKTEGINEFVWVPVGDISDIYDEANNAGQLWYFGTSSSPKNPAVKQTYPTTKNSGFREPDVVTSASSGSDSTSGTSYDAVSTNLQQAGLSSTATASTFKTQLQNEFKEMIKSVKTYGGFYIGRYETGNLSNSTKAVVQKNNSDINNQTWYTMYKVCKTIKANDNVATSMLWGCQWDAILRWMQTSTNSEVASFPTNSTGKGNYSGTQGSTDKAIPTGSNPNYAVNNIYDMAGNVFDWTMEADGTYYRVMRGGFYNVSASNYPASNRGGDLPPYSYSYNGCRSTLYAK